jgi:hypothetical protein
MDLFLKNYFKFAIPKTDIQNNFENQMFRLLHIMYNGACAYGLPDSVALIASMKPCQNLNPSLDWSNLDYLESP